MLVWEQLALLAVASDDHIVQAAQRYIAARLDDRVPHRTVSEKLRARTTRSRLVRQATGLRTVHAVSPEQVAQLEDRCGTRALVASRQQARRADSEAYLE